MAKIIQISTVGNGSGTVQLFALLDDGNIAYGEMHPKEKKKGEVGYRWFGDLQPLPPDMASTSAK